MQPWKTGAMRLSLVSACAVFACTKLESPSDSFDAGTTSGALSSVVSSSSARSSAATSAATAASVASAGAAPGSASVSGGSQGSSCTDPTGFDGLGCYRCEPTDTITLQRACTDAACTPFDNAARLTKIGESGALPELPEPEVPTPVPSTAATSDAVDARDASLGDASMDAEAAPDAGGATDGSTPGTALPSASSGVATSGTPCSDLATNGTVIYVTGSTAVKPFLQQIGQQLSAVKVYIVYTSTGSCVGVDAILNDTPMTSGPPPAPALSATYWESSSSTGKACDLPADGVAADIGVSDVFSASCPGFELLDLETLSVRDAPGPIQTMTFSVPAASKYTEISAQAAYFVFGFGAAGGVRDADSGGAMWNDEEALLQRSPSSGTQAMIAAAIGVPATAWKGKLHKTSDDVAAALQAAGDDPIEADKTLGILAADYIETKNLRAQVRSLAFQDTAQPCAVYPDSTSKARDKRNVRDGHYPIWGPLHVLYKVNDDGLPRNPATRQRITDIAGYLSGTKALPNGVKLIDVYADSGLVPECAMRVTRTRDGGNIIPYVSPNPCSCLFDLRATGATSCATCKVQADCATGQTCSQGYCESQ
jgi:hypothetical protein